MNIPFEIYDIIYLHHQLCDKWSVNYSNKTIKVDSTQSLIVAQTHGISTAFGQFIISSGVFKWQIRIISINKSNGNKTNMFTTGPYIGIVDIDSDDKYLTKYQNDDDWDDIGYQYCAGIGELICSITNGQQKTRESWLESCWKRVGDVLEMELDLNQRTLSFRINDGNINVGFSNIKQARYRLAFTFDGNQKGSQFVILPKL